MVGHETTTAFVALDVVRSAIPMVTSYLVVCALLGRLLRAPYKATVVWMKARVVELKWDAT